MDNKYTNRLIEETSPYLLQHAHNPVNWYPWGEQALSVARSENKVILVSIGYSACHWCHVMERESFENESVAEIMNTHFINIKIDREERPDLDHIYMDAVQAINGNGGWPLNVFLTPAAKPFFGATYFPPTKAYNRSSWTEVLQGISKAWKERENEIVAQAENLTAHLKESNLFAQTKTKDFSGEDEAIITQGQCDAMFTTIMNSADTQWGGFGNAPKFPQTFTIQYLLQYHHFTGNVQALSQALLSIDKMLTGGIYDHVAGGLARYSTDREWLAPHFEKMLYDNALLINILCDAFQLTADKRYEQAIRKTILFISNELLSEQGGFFAALDADSEGEEGKYYVWKKSDVDKLLGHDSALFASFFDISEAGNWEGKNILRILKPVDEFVSEKQLRKEAFLETIQQGLNLLSKERNYRVKPALDDKIILGWNALMIKALAKTATVLQDNTYREMAIENFGFLQAAFQVSEGSGLLHTYKNGIAKYPAFLDDYAYLVAAGLQLYNATFNVSYLQTAHDYCNYVIENFGDNDTGLFFFTEAGQKDIIIRKKEIYDGATPSGNAVMAENLFRLSIIFERPEWRERAEKMCGIISPLATKYPGSFGVWASLLLQLIPGINEISVIGGDFISVSNNILLKYIPNLVLMSSNAENNHFAMIANKAGKTNATQIFLCKNYACMEPFSETDSVLKQITKSDKISK